MANTARHPNALPVRCDLGAGHTGRHSDRGWQVQWAHPLCDVEGRCILPAGHLQFAPSLDHIDREGAQFREREVQTKVTMTDDETLMMKPTCSEPSCAMLTGHTGPHWNAFRGTWTYEHEPCPMNHCVYYSGHAGPHRDRTGYGWSTGRAPIPPPVPPLPDCPEPGCVLQIQHWGQHATRKGTLWHNTNHSRTGIANPTDPTKEIQDVLTDALEQTRALRHRLEHLAKETITVHNDFTDVLRTTNEHLAALTDQLIEPTADRYAVADIRPTIFGHDRMRELLCDKDCILSMPHVGPCTSDRSPR